MLSKEILQKRLGERIRLLRESKDITQQELASTCDFEKSNMSRIEAGNTNPTYITLVKISQALSVQLKDLLDFPVE